MAENRKVFDLTDIFKYDLEDFGIWGNSFGYIVTLTILAFMYYNKPVWVKPKYYDCVGGYFLVKEEHCWGCRA
jgi:hypothetical protein